MYRILFAGQIKALKAWFEYGSPVFVSRSSKSCTSTDCERTVTFWKSFVTDQTNSLTKTQGSRGGGGGGAPLVTQYWGGGTKHFYLLNLYNFKNIGGHVPPLPPPPYSAVPETWHWKMKPSEHIENEFFKVRESRSIQFCPHADQSSS